MKVFKNIYNHLNQPIVDRYGLGKIIRKYGFYPLHFPIAITGEHGPSLKNGLGKEALSQKNLFYFFSAKYKTNFNFRNKIPIRHPSPFVWYRRKNKIEKDPNVGGSVFFLSHSTKLVKASTDFKKLFSEISKLPADFYPVDFCIHFNDRIESVTKVLECEGYRWFSLTKNYEENQIEKFYNIIPHYKYAISNRFSSALFYCVEMGIPCSIISYDTVTYKNFGNKEFDISVVSESSQKAVALFRGVNQKITHEQLKFAEVELGLDLINTKLNRVKIMVALYISLLHGIIILILNKLIKTIKRYLY